MGDLESLSLVYICGEYYACGLLFFFFFRTGHLQCYTREHGPRLGEIVFDRETVAVIMIAEVRLRPG